jgi:hypothetical protein
MQASRFWAAAGFANNSVEKFRLKIKLRLLVETERGGTVLPDLDAAGQMKSSSSWVAGSPSALRCR